MRSFGLVPFVKLQNDIKINIKSVCVSGLELVGDSYRTVAGAVIQMFWPVGVFILTGVAYGLRDWS